MAGVLSSAARRFCGGGWLVDFVQPRRSRLVRQVHPAMRAWVDHLLGSMIPGEEKDAVLRETLAEVMSGHSSFSSCLDDSAEAFSGTCGACCVNTAIYSSWAAPVTDLIGGSDG